MKPTIRTFFDPATNTATHLVSDPETGAAAIVDPVLDFDPASGRLGDGERRRDPRGDRGQGARSSLCARNPCSCRSPVGRRLYPARDRGEDRDRRAHYRSSEGLRAAVRGRGCAARWRRLRCVDGRGSSRFLSAISRSGFLPTPGHTPACVTYLIGDAAFVGDTLFMPDYGTARTDFPGGDAATLLPLDPGRFSICRPTPGSSSAMIICPKERADYRWQTTVAEERTNIHVHDGVSEAEFVAMRAGPPTRRSPRLGSYCPRSRSTFAPGRFRPQPRPGRCFFAFRCAKSRNRPIPAQRPRAKVNALARVPANMDG